MTALMPMKGPTAAQSKAFVESVLGPFDDVRALESAIVQLSAGMRTLSESRLRRDTIILLLQDATGLGKKQIGFVLNALEQLEQSHLKPAKKA